MARAPTPSLVLVGAALLAGAAVLWSTRGDGPDPSASGRASPLATNSFDTRRETTPGAEHTVQRGDDREPPTFPDRPAKSESLDALRHSIPAGKPEEYAVTRFAQNKRTPRWLRDIVVEASGVDLFPEPPFSARFMFGESDRPWLERVQAAYRAALKERAAAAGYGGLATADDAIAEQVRSEVRRPFRRLLRDGARERFETSPELQARFFDPRPIAEMTPGSPEYFWLAEFLLNRWPNATYVVGLNDPQDRKYLAATDVTELVRLQLDIAHAFREDEKRRMSRGEGLAVSKEHTVQLLRPFAERLQALVNARKPRDG